MVALSGPMLVLLLRSSLSVFTGMHTHDGRAESARLPDKASLRPAWLVKLGVALQGSRRWGYNQFHPALPAARARADDFASVVSRDNAAPALRACISCDGCRKIILGADIGTHHVMKNRNDLKSFGAASGAHLLVALDLHQESPNRRTSMSATCAEKFV